MNKGNAFTLVEMLTAVLIYSLVLGAVYLSFHSGINAWNKGEERMGLYQESRLTLNGLSRELRCAFVSSTDEEIKFTGTDQRLEIGDADALSFFTVPLLNQYNVSNNNKPSALVKVDYSIEYDPEEDKFFLQKKETPVYGPEAGEERIKRINYPCSGLNLKFYDGTKWLNEWEATGGLPQAVDISFNLQDEGKKKFTFKDIIFIHTGKEYRF